MFYVHVTSPRRLTCQGPLQDLPKHTILLQSPGMEKFFSFFEDNVAGIVVFLLSVFALLLLLKMAARIMGFGRYRHSDNTSSSTGYILTQLAVKIITEFRHFLALVLVLIFATALGYALYTANKAANDPDALSKSLQAVMSTLGGLVGSIVGYYFGESAAARSNNRDTDSNGNPPTQRQPDNQPLVEALRPADAQMEEE